jgi:hypothetical protein
MKTTILAILSGAVLVGVLGCVSTVNDRTTPGMPFVKDKIEGRYERPVDECFNAAKDVVRTLGTLTSEEILHSATNAVSPVKIVTGKVNQRSVWVRIEAVDPTVTAVVVQTRTPGGSPDIDLASEIDKRIALKLVK